MKRSNKLPGGQHGVDIDTIHGKKTKQTFENKQHLKHNRIPPGPRVPTNETLLPNKLPRGHHSVDVDTIHGKNKLFKMRNTQNKTRSHQVLESQPMKRYYRTNCPEAILMNKRGRIDSPFVDTQKAMLQYILHIW